MKANLLNRLSCENSQKKLALVERLWGLSAVRSTLYKEKPAVFLCYDVAIDSEQTSSSTDEIDEIKWASLTELKDLDWVSQTMHNLALDGLSGERMSLKSSRPITKSDTYHVYSVNRQSKNIGQ